MHLLAEMTAGGQLVGLGVMLMIAAILMRRNSAQRRNVRTRDPLQQVHAEFQKIEASHAGRITKLEVHLHDFAREVEGRIQTRLALLDRLILDADEEIGQLERLLVESRDTRRTSPAQSELIPAPHAPLPGVRNIENRVFPPDQRNSEAA